jgi:hypothetical protein
MNNIKQGWKLHNVVHKITSSILYSLLLGLLESRNEMQISLNKICGCAEYMENSIYGLMQTIFYYGSAQLKIGRTFGGNLPHKILVSRKQFSYHFQFVLFTWIFLLTGAFVVGIWE